MEVFEVYETALQEYRAGNYDKSLEILNELKKIVPNWAKTSRPAFCCGSAYCIGELCPFSLSCLIRT